MRLRNIALAGIILLVLAITAGTGMADPNVTAGQANVAGNITDSTASTASGDIALVDDIDPEEPLIGPGHALYGLSLAFEKLGTTFTFDPEEKLGKQVSYARHRIAEAKAELKKKNPKAAEIAFEKYQEEMNEAEHTISGISGRDTGLVNAQKMIAKHQYVLNNLLNQTPNSTGLQRALNNSEELQKKFSEKTGLKYSRMSRGGHDVLKEEHDESEDANERTQIKAEVTSNGSTVKIQLRFQTNSTNETDIVADTLEELKNLRINLSENLKLEHDSIDVEGTPTSTFTPSDDEKDSKEYKVKLDVKAKVEADITDVKVEYKFHLNETTKSGIVDGINQKLLELNSDAIIKGLELKVLEHKKVENGKDIEKSRETEKSKEVERTAKVEKKGERETKE